MSADIAAKQRLFIAIWPDESIRQQLCQWQRLVLDSGIKGRAPRRENLHLTMAFLGDTSESQAQAAIRMVQEFRFAPTELCFDRVGYWPRNRLLWAGCRNSPPEFAREVKRLQRELMDCGFVPDRRDYEPHVTLLRKASAKPRVKINPIIWPVLQAVLMRSTLHPAGAIYQRIATSEVVD